MSTADPGSWSRLEQALDVWLRHVESGAVDGTALLAAHPGLRDLLEPMLADRDREEPVGRVVGDYRLGPELGRGGMGIVYEAWQRSLGRKVALKVLAPALAADPGAIARFHREAAAAGKLRHPGIVEIHGVGRDGDVHWFAMALVEGEPLHRRRERFRSPPAAVGLVAQVLDALQHAHAAGLVHRDVKPANILVGEHDHVVLTDFGLARAKSAPAATVEGGFLGTLDYAAPEQILAQGVDARADVWSTGVVLAELLTGTHPFAGGTATQTLHAILTKEPGSLGRATGLDPDLAAIVLRALEKDPGRRYPSAVAFLADLRAWQQGLPVAARLPTVRERLWRTARREPWRALAAALLVVGVPLLAVVGGHLLANAPRIEAATRAEQAARREQALTAAWIALNEERFEDGLRELAPWLADDGDLEIRYAQATLRTGTPRAMEAFAVLQPFAGTRVFELVSLLLKDAGHDLPFGFETVEGHTMLECATLGQLAFDQVRVHRRSASFYRHAARWYGRAVALSPQPRAWLLLQWAIAAARQDDAEAFANALAAYEQHFPGTRGLQLLYVFGAGHAPIERGLQLLGGTELDGDARVHLARAQLLARAGRPADAILAAERGLAIRPDLGRGWQQLARLRRSTKDLTGALAAARCAEAADATSGEAAGLAGAILVELGNFESARTALERALELEPGEWRHAHNLGLALHDLHLDAAALQAFERAAELAPAQAAPLACMARTLKRLGRPEEAFLAEARAQAADRTDFRSAMLLASRASEVGLFDIARRSAERATQMAPDADETWWRLAEVHVEAVPGDPAAAAAAVARALAIGAPVTPRQRSIWGRVEAANGRVAAAIEHLEAAMGEADKIPPLARGKAQALLTRLRAQ